MDNNAQPSPFRIGSSESSGNVSDDSSYSEDFAGEPAEYDPQLTPERARLNGYDSSETFSDILEDVVINHRIHHGGTLPRPVFDFKDRRHPRQEDTINTNNAVDAFRLPAMHANRRSSMTSTDSDKYGILDDTDLSVNSLTSVNSISSLLREKLLMNIQKISKNKEVQADYKLRAFIICLFVVIVCVIKFAHVYYDRHVLQASHDDFAYRRTDGLPVLNYTICSARNMKTLHTALSEKMLWDGLKASDTEIINSLLTEPVWQLAPTKKELLNESTMVNYTEDIIALGFIKQGHVLLNEFWQAEMGDFSLDQKRFPTMKETINIIHRRGFRIVVTIQPFISTESRNFAAAVREGILVKEIGSEGDVPALTRYKTVQSAGVLDITNKKCGPWLQQQLKDLVEKYQFDAFYLDTGSAYDLPRHYLFRENLSNPDYYKSLFTQVVSDSVNVFAVSSAISRPPAPIFVSLLSLASTWDSLQVIIPTMLTYGIVGYPFLLPGPVGGDFQVGNVLSHALIPPDNTSNESLIVQALKECRQRGQNYNESRELVMRWMQLATFLPVIRYARLPSDCDPQVLQLTKNLTSLRQQIINPLLKRYVQEALETAVPLIRPLWMLDPSDPTCYIVKDEFSVGEEVIVAPILRPGTTEREVYLPAGVWKDGIEGSLRKGSRWIHNYKIPLTKIAYFIKMPNNTRF
ncbi:Hypothetical protein CINCED_3A003311 [Cinara cedri]|uniref:Uncharacterized protein n=1 Tax=Cinara cedri TaxID=506608 RepID=A0A5E4NBT6_9HEMI|nr:Hypothetical protein CINCED_3A003311 [Cinara cedri]